MTKEELGKATGQELIDERNYCGVDGYYGDYLDNVNEEMLKRFNRFAKLEKELEQERKLNAEIKARFVKCNTCTDEMKDKCLMFSENLCEGERCEELVDLMALVSKSDLQKENEQLKEKNRQLSNEVEDLTAYCNQIGKIKTDVLKLFEHIVAR